MNWLNRLFKNQKGVFLVFTAVLLPIIFACAGLAMDLGNAFAHKSKLQNAADAAVLVYGTLYNTDKESAKEQAIKYMDANMQGISYKIKEPLLIRKDEKKNVMRASLYVEKEVPTTFMRIVGINTVNVKVEATCNIPQQIRGGGAGVFKYSFIGAAGPNDGKSALWFQNEGHKIEGDIHANGKVSVAWITTDNDEKRCVLIDSKYGKFTTGIKNDLDLWSTQEVNQYQVNAEPMKHINDIPFPGNVADPKATIKNTTTVPAWQEPYNNNKFYHLLNFGYIDDTELGKTAYGRDVLASECYDPSIGNQGNLDISLKEGSTETGEIYKFIESYKAKYDPWKDPAWDYKPDEWVTVGSGRGFDDYYEGHRYSVIIADGDISLYPKNIDWDADHLTVISLHGNVNIAWNGDEHNTLKALIYAPNGDINYGGNNKTFEGSMVAQHITSTASGATYRWNDFGFGGSGSGSGSTGGGSSGVTSNEKIKLQSDPDNDEAYSVIDQVTFN